MTFKIASKSSRKKFDTSPHGITQGLLIFSDSTYNTLIIKNYLFMYPFEQELDKENRWVKLASQIPWDLLAAVYSRKLDADSGRKSVNIRTMIAALIVKHKLGLDNRGTRGQLQYISCDLNIVDSLLLKPGRSGLLEKCDRELMETIRKVYSQQKPDV